MDKSQKGYRIGVTLMLLGLVFLILNAFDYLFGWSFFPTGLILPSGIVMNILGFYIAGRYKN